MKKCVRCRSRQNEADFLADEVPIRQTKGCQSMLLDSDNAEIVVMLVPIVRI